MAKYNLTPRQKLFAEQCMLIHTHNSHTDAYIAIYKPTGSRRTATSSASRIYNRPAVQAYVDDLYEVSTQRAIDRQEAERKAFQDQLRSSLNKRYNIRL